MKHQVSYKNAPLDWKDGLPLGNGVFGGMTYYQENHFIFLMNHYEVYYRKHQKYSKKYQEQIKAKANEYRDGSRYQKMVTLAENNFSDYKEDAAYNYFETLYHFSDTYGHGLRGVNHMPTGELTLGFANELKEGDYSFRLLTEEAKCELQLAKDVKQIKVTTLVTREKDVILQEVEQSESNLIEEIILAYPKRRYQNSFVHKFQKITEKLFYLQVTFSCGLNEDAEDFTFVVMIGLEGACGELHIKAEQMRIRIYEQEKRITIMTTVLTEEKSQNLIQDAKIQLQEYLSNQLCLKKEHQSYWHSFFHKGRVSLPDRFLENLWYLNLYALGCSSGKGGKCYPDASGLNGLWDVKQPSIWGSSWYWDVNIQASYWPVYTAGHLELSDVFIEALLFYTAEMEAMTKRDYGLDGYAMDYPHMLYNCIQPWCAQWLWWHYEYTRDVFFLQEKAYPYFKKLLQFITKVIRWDEKSQTYYFYPEISPEQGPLTKNTTITLATVKYLLTVTLETVKILSLQEEKEKHWRQLLNQLAPYPLDRHPIEGEIIKDSEYASPQLHLRHPSLLVVIAGTALNVLFTAIGAFVLSRKEFPLRKVMTVMIIFTMYFSGGMIPRYLFINDTLGMGNSMLALMLPGLISTYNLIVMRTNFESIPESLIESAKMDGATEITVLFRIVLPLSKAIIAVMVLMYGVSHWNAWFDAMLFIRGRALYPLQIILREILISNSTDSMASGALGDIEAIGESIKYATIVISTFPILCLYPFVQKYFTKGVMVGAVKG